MSKSIFREIQNVFDSQIREFDCERKVTSRCIGSCKRTSPKRFVITSMRRYDPENSKYALAVSLKWFPNPFLSMKFANLSTNKLHQPSWTKLISTTSQVLRNKVRTRCYHRKISKLLWKQHFSLTFLIAKIENRDFDRQKWALESS